MQCKPPFERYTQKAVTDIYLLVRAPLYLLHIRVPWHGLPITSLHPALAILKLMKRSLNPLLQSLHCSGGSLRPPVGAGQASLPNRTPSGTSGAIVADVQDPTCPRLAHI